MQRENDDGSSTGTSTNEMEVNEGFEFFPYWVCIFRWQNISVVLLFKCLFDQRIRDSSFKRNNALQQWKVKH